MHTDSEETAEKFKAMLKQYSALPKSTEQIYQSVQMLRKAVEYHEQILEQGDAYLLDTEYMEKWIGMDLLSPKTVDQMLAYYAHLSGSFPISSEYLAEINHLQLSLKYLAEARQVPPTANSAIRCCRALCRTIELISQEGDENYPCSKILKKLKGLTNKVKSKIPQRCQRAGLIRAIKVETHPSQKIKDACCKTFFDRRDPHRTIYWTQGRAGNLEYKTRVTALHKAMNELQTLEKQVKKIRSEKILNPICHNLSKEDFTIRSIGKKLCPFLTAGGSFIAKALSEDGMRQIFQENDIEVSEQSRLALIFEDMKRSEERKFKERQAKKQLQPKKSSTNDYAYEKVNGNDFWTLMFHRQL